MKNQMSKHILKFNQFASVFLQLKNQVLSHVDLYYQKIDLHFGNYQVDGDQRSSDLVLYVSGFWEVLGSDQTQTDETKSPDEIEAFFKQQLGSKVQSVELLEKTKECFILLSTGFTIHIRFEKPGRWIELMQRDGLLTSITTDGEYFQDNKSQT